RAQLDHQRKSADGKRDVENIGQVHHRHLHRAVTRLAPASDEVDVDFALHVAELRAGAIQVPVDDLQCPGDLEIAHIRPGFEAHIQVIRNDAEQARQFAADL